MRLPDFWNYTNELCSPKFGWWLFSEKMRQAAWIGSSKIASLTIALRATCRQGWLCVDCRQKLSSLKLKTKGTHRRCNGPVWDLGEKLKLRKTAFGVGVCEVPMWQDRRLHKCDCNVVTKFAPAFLLNLLKRPAFKDPLVGAEGGCSRQANCHRRSPDDSQPGGETKPRWQLFSTSPSSLMMNWEIYHSIALFFVWRMSRFRDINNPTSIWTISIGNISFRNSTN